MAGTLSLESESAGDTDPGSAGLPGLALAGLLSLGAGAVHAAAAGIHAEHPQLARLFVGIALLQMAAGLVALIRPTRAAGAAMVLVNGASVVGWLVTRTAGISWIDGLETSESPQFADTACAVLSGGAIVVTLAILLGWRPQPGRLALPGVVVTALVIPAMLLAVTHDHARGEGDDHGDEVAGDGHDHGTAAPADGGAVAVHDDGDDHHGDPASDHGDTGGEMTFAAWPRPWDPAEPLDLTNIEGVTPEQEARAAQLVEDSLRELPRYADPQAAIDDGYASIGDGLTGSEHFIKNALINDDVLLDATAPESLVYSVVNGERTLAGAMYISSARPSDDPVLTDYAGPLMQWHKHDNLCWGTGADGKPRIVGLIDAEGNCATGTRGGGENPMVHVWVTPHPCGVFAALEGIGAGTAIVPDAERVDMCQMHDHGDTETAAVSRPYDPTMPIDLSGFDGVTPQQQAAAENLIAVNIVDLPQWSDYRDAEAAGFRSIGDGATGAEHFVQWAWINDDVILDPDQPESLVYEPQPDGSKKLVSAMYMMPEDVGLDEVPDIGGDLMQWHIHSDLCFSGDATQRTVGGFRPVGGTCREGLTVFEAAMIHVWITPHDCGPFASLEGVGAGQVLEGEERLCDELHGS